MRGQRRSFTVNVYLRMDEHRILCDMLLVKDWRQVHCCPNFWKNGKITLQWRHNRRDSVSNHQPHDCLLNRLFRHWYKKTSKFRVTGLCKGNSPGTGELPTQMAIYAENVSIWWRHHDGWDKACHPSGRYRDYYSVTRSSHSNPFEGRVSYSIFFRKFKALPHIR